MIRKLSIIIFIFIQVSIFWHWNSLASSAVFEFGSEYWSEVKHLDSLIKIYLPIIYSILQIFFIKNWKLFFLFWFISFFIIQGLIVGIYGAETLLLQIYQFLIIVVFMILDLSYKSAKKIPATTNSTTSK